MLKKLLSYIIPFTVEKRKAELSGELQVALENGRYVLNTKTVNYSFGGLHTIFDKAFARLEIGKFPAKKILVLGFGTGSVAELLREKYMISAGITGIERDQVVIDLAKEYFDTGRFRNLEILHEEAGSFLHKTNDRYDLIIVDVFIGTKVPPHLEENKFLDDLKQKTNSGGMILFNRAYFDADTKQQTEQLAKKMTARVGPTEPMPLKAYGLKNCILVTRIK